MESEADPGWGGLYESDIFFFLNYLDKIYQD